MKKYLTGGFMAAPLLALTVCQQDAGGAERNTQGTTTRQQDRGPSVTLHGPRLGFDGKIKLGCCSPGFSMY
ncbi:hypothetical protein AIOL_002379 [Candidatus Rhodobacter oscarellae]|uniref:Uncharacterized protein n=1 Tax=Candidatus Rhodobacter oscarellae TaxID=1675527 RepID=A0A0J9E3P1_9RHOB|nr:hypothetical protein [Candidatus Rhodobacter lobularis]KMW57415.1 hypothetical protein AIOL_002379 [Candidatus Rhodobacter lobularis]